MLLLATLLRIIITTCPRYNSPAGTILLGAAVAEETAVLAVRDVMIPVADSGAHGTAASTVGQATGVAVIPMLVHENLATGRFILIE